MPDRVFQDTLKDIAAAAPPDRTDWWIIGSAALRLCGIIGQSMRDVDILAGHETARDFLSHWKQPLPTPEPDPFFRSDPFAQITRPGLLPIDLLGDLHLYEKGRWNPVTLKSRLAVDCGETRVFVPSLEDQLMVLRRFGREKDLERAALIEAALA